MKFIWHRLLTNPGTEVESVEGDTVRLRVEGLVCSGVCAVRTRQALLRIDGVQRVRVDFDNGIAVIEGAPADAGTYQRAVASVVVGKPLRRLIERVAARLAHKSPAAATPGERA